MQLVAEKTGADKETGHWRPELSDKQSVAWWLLQKPHVRELLYGGSKGGGKSVFGCIWLYFECLDIAYKYIPEPLKDPIPIAFMGRKVAKHFKETTLDTWKRFVPPDHYLIKGDPAEITIANRVIIRTGGLEAKEELEKFNSAEFARIFIDQAEETSKDDISVLRACLRLIINGNKIPGKILWTANPAQCWLKTEFITTKTTKKPFVQALPGDNPYLGEEYIETLKESFSHRPELLSAYLYGSWSALEGVGQVIKDSWVQMAKQRIRLNMQTAHKVIACDVARFGDDETVIYYMEDGIIVDELIYGQKDTVFTASQLILMMDEKECSTIVIDADGVGGGVVDQIEDVRKSKKKHWNIVSVNGAAKSISEKYHNKRAEVWDVVAKRFSGGTVILRSDGKTDLVLENQLCIPTYEFRNGRLLIEKKEEIKKRLGSSPDRADAYVMGLWATETQTIPEDVAVGIGIDTGDYDPWASTGDGRDYDPLHRRERRERRSI